MCTPLPQLDKMSDTRTPLSYTPPNLGVLAFTAWTCSRRNGIAEETRHPCHAEILVKDTKIKLAKIMGLEEGNLSEAELLWENIRCSVILFKLCTVTEAYFMFLTNTQSLTKYASIEKVPGCANNSTLTFKQNQPIE